MSYSTRRSGAYGQQPQPQQNVSAIGQRRQPVVTNNYVSSGNPQKPVQPQQAQQRQQQQQAQAQSTNIQFRNQQLQQPKPAVQQPQQKPVAQQQQPVVQQQQQPAPPQQAPVAAAPQVKLEQTAAAVAAVTADATGGNSIPMDQQPNGTAPSAGSAAGDGTETMETSVEGGPRKKPFWNKSGNRISKREKIRRRNIQLSKVLQPKNAVMILNELVGKVTYNTEELPMKTDGIQFKVTALVDGIEHVGYGHGKNAAKNAAAEVALKYIVKHNKLTEVKNEDDGTEKMDVTEDDTKQPLPWQHVASFALFKLFCSWGEDPNAVKSQLMHQMGIATAAPTTIMASGEVKPPEMRPAKKMPANPELMNPLMLINQMLPHAMFEEIGKSGNPPHISYSFRCTVGDESFVGTGPNKKHAKKMAAFAACSKILKIDYPKEVYISLPGQ